MGLGPPSRSWASVFQPSWPRAGIRMKSLIAEKPRLLFGGCKRLITISEHLAHADFFRDTARIHLACNFRTRLINTSQTTRVLSRKNVDFCFGRNCYTQKSSMLSASYLVWCPTGLSPVSRKAYRMTWSCISLRITKAWRKHDLDRCFSRNQTENGCTFKRLLRMEKSQQILYTFTSQT